MNFEIYSFMKKKEYFKSFKIHFVKILCILNRKIT